MGKVSAKPTILTEPGGATVWVKPYLEREAPWQRVGETPVRDVRLPIAPMRWRIEKPGFASILRAGSPGKYDGKTGAFVPETYTLKLVPKPRSPSTWSASMVPTNCRSSSSTGGRSPTVSSRRSWTPEDTGTSITGSTSSAKEGRVLPWAEAMQAFVDRTREVRSGHVGGR